MATVIAPAVTAAATANPPDPNIKYLVVAIDNKTGSLSYVVGDDSKIVDLASTSYTPYEVIENTIDNSTESTQYVKIKVQKSPTKPIGASTDRNPYFELNKNWYTLLLDQFANPIETSGVVEKTWFTDYGLEQDPFIIFKRFRFYNNDMIVQNIRFLIDLPATESNFFTKFPDLEANKIASLPDIQKSLVKPFFAIKTVLDMRQNRKKLDDNGQPVIDKATGKPIIIEGYFVNGRQRYGYPNITGDLSHIISALQLLFDVVMYCPDCTITAFSTELKELHRHITLRKFFLGEDESEQNIMDFYEKVKRDVDTDPFTFLSGYLNTTIGVFRTGQTITYGQNLLIVQGDTIVEKTRGYELIGQICKLQDVEHYVYYNYKEKMLYNDVEIREDKQGNQVLYYIDNNMSISLYRKLESTYRDLLKTKYYISDDEIEFTLKQNKTLLFVDNFMSNDLTIDNDRIRKFMLQYLSSRSKRELDKNIKSLFSGEHFKFGICNYTGDMSYFTAAMQMLYDCVPFRSQIEYIRTELGNTATVKMFEFQLLNNEYCLSRIFDNIQVTNDPQNGRKNYDPLELTVGVTLENGSKSQENVFFNYQICVNFIMNSNIVSNLEFPTDRNSVFPEYKFENILDNYYYKRVANNLLDIGIAAGGASANAATAYLATNPDELSKNWYAGKYLDSFKLAFSRGVPEDVVEDVRNEQIDKKRQMADDERREAARKLLQREIATQIPNYTIANRSVPAIITNKCVDIIHKLILILYRKFNVFIDFEDDERGFEEKTRNYKDAATDVKSPNFVIRIGRLPREPLKSVNNWIKISGVPLTNPNAEFINGVYKPVTSGYKHTEHNDVTLSNPSAGSWQIVITVGGTAYQVANGAPTFDLDVPTSFQVKTTRFNDNTDNNFSPFDLTRTNVGETYLPQTGEKDVDQIDATTDLPPNYTFSPANYSTVGTIFKSIHHDYYYKYYNHLQKILLFDSEAIYDVESVNRYTVGMFPFIRLYKRDDYKYEPAKTSKNPGDELIYKDVVTFLDFMDRELHA
jgi:hypothetical protein